MCFSVHAVDERGKTVLRRQLRRDQMAAFFAKPAAVPHRHGGVRQRGILGAHATELRPHARSMSPQFVKPYVKSNRTSGDAEAICEAVRVPTCALYGQEREQQAVLSLHRVRQGFVKARTAQANQIRSLLGEFGLIMPAGVSHMPSAAGPTGRHQQPCAWRVASAHHALRPSTSKTWTSWSMSSRPRSRLGTTAASQHEAGEDCRISPWERAEWHDCDGQLRQRQAASARLAGASQHSSGGKPTLGHQQAR